MFEVREDTLFKIKHLYCMLSLSHHDGFPVKIDHLCSILLVTKIIVTVTNEVSCYDRKILVLPISVRICTSDKDFRQQCSDFILFFPPIHTQS